MVRSTFWKNIRFKTLAIIAITILGMTIVVHAISATISNDSFSTLENNEINDDLNVLERTLQKEQDDLASRASDWSNWNDTYFFVIGENPDFIDANMGNLTFENLDIDTMLFFNYEGEFIYGETYDPSSGAWSGMPDGMTAHVGPDGYLMTRARASEQTVGMISLPECPMMICANPILDNNGEGPVNGMLLLGCWMDGGESTSLSETANLDVSFHEPSDEELVSAIGAENFERLNRTGSAIVPLSEDIIGGYVMATDIYGNPVMVVEMDSTRDIFAIGQSGQSVLLTSLVISGVIFGIVTLFLLESQVVSKISRLSNEVSNIARAGDTKRRVTNIGNDEITELGSNINGMLVALDNSRQELMEAERANRDKLEQQVRERTVELVESNRALVTEIEERQRTEEQLRESESRYRAVVEDQMELICRTRPDGTMTFANQAYCRYFSVDPQALIGTKYKPAMSGADEELVRRHLGWLSLTKPVISYQYRVRMPDGSENWQQWTSRGIFDASGAMVEIQSVGRDITDKVKLEQELLKTQKLESVGRMAGGIAHDFNNILTSIIGNITIAKMDKGLPSNVSKRLSDAENSVLRAKNLTQQLLTFSEGGNPVKERTSYAELLRSAVELTLRGTNVHADFRIDDGLWDVEVDKGQMRQVAFNIVQNAVDAMPLGGRMEISAWNWNNTGENGVPLPFGRYVVVAFKDQGPGIPPDNLARIFDPFFTTKTNGGGLGLTAAISIVRKHGGHLEVRSAKGEGSTFLAYIPALVDAESEEGYGTFPMANEVPRVLLMDDEVSILEVVTELMTMLGYEVECARDGQEALDLYGAAVRRGQEFDLVIMDLTIPGGMGGKEAIKKLLESYPKARAIVSSGYSNDPVMSDHASHGFIGVLQKPYTVQELKQALAEALVTPR